jgi:hypothetical protein
MLTMLRGMSELLFEQWEELKESAKLSIDRGVERSQY